jgi:hypothetical protein
MQAKHLSGAPSMHVSAPDTRLNLAQGQKLTQADLVLQRVELTS